ncbi:MAG: Gfo/Idh/MocA family oxidoreductase, partial [Candidatus Bathyarchaeota archaeon]|nr:Gfo/Idh/MocA family oxidoreductase [Candidatus Bathyarchaeota archaeon]
MLRLGIVGCGRVTTLFHLKAIEEVEGVTVAAVADLARASMEMVKKKSGAARGYADFLELLSDPDVDAVAVNTPPRFHEEMVLASLRAGKHVLCEKPLANSVEGCIHIRESQEGSGLVVMPVHNYALTPCVETARGLIVGSEIGAVKGIRIRFDNNLWGYGSKTDFRLKEKHGIVYDVLPHILSVASMLSGPVSRVDGARGWAKRYGVIDNLSLRMEAGEGVGVNCEMNWTSLIPSFRMDVEGGSGRVGMEIMKRPFRVSVESDVGNRTIDREGLGKYLDILRI